MEQQELITPQVKDETAEKVRETTADIQKDMELKKQKHLSQLQNRLNNKRQKVAPSYLTSAMNMYTLALTYGILRAFWGNFQDFLE